MNPFRKIRVQLVVIVLVCYMVPMLVLGTYVDGGVLRDLRDKTEAALTTGLEYSAMLAGENLQAVVSLSRDATYDGELTDAAAQRDAGGISSNEFLRLARNYIERKYGRESILTFAACFTLDNPDLLLVNHAGTSAAARYQTSAHEAVKALGEELDTQGRFLQVDGALYLVRNLVNLRMKPYGMLVLGLDAQAVFGSLATLAKDWDARLDIRLDGLVLDDMTASGMPLPEGADWDALPAGRVVPAGSGCCAALRDGSSRDYALRAALLLSRERLYGELHGFRRTFLILMALLVPLLAAIALYVYRRITRPIGLLAEAAGRIEAGELGVTVPMQGEDELGRLGKAFSNMSLRLRELIDKTYKEEIALRDARVQAMQSRINPHFINNALETINWQARMEGSETISAMVESLSVLLNAGMSRNNRRMLPLREELDTVRAYFYFIGLRFGDRLSTRVEVAPGALDDILPALTLQPVIENAAEHGIAPAGGGEIVLRGAHAEGRLRLEVANSGRLPTEGDWEHIRAALRGDNQGGSHLGLANIVTRLRLIYGDRASIRVTADGLWLYVTLEVPQGEGSEE